MATSPPPPRKTAPKKIASGKTVSTRTTATKPAAKKTAAKKTAPKKPTAPTAVPAALPNSPGAFVSSAPRGSDSRPAQLFLGALIMGVANRMLTGASNHHRRHWNVGMSEWRALIALDGADEMIVREVAETADLDYALASKSLKVLGDRGLVTMRQTRSRGRATVVALTAAGKALRAEMMALSTARQERLLKTFSAAEADTLRELLVRLEAQIPCMNA